MNIVLIIISHTNNVFGFVYEEYLSLLTVNMNRISEPFGRKRRDTGDPDVQNPRHYGLTTVLLNLGLSK
jgi:hypothetical protein